MKNTRWTIMAALLLAATSVTQAQDAPAPGAPGTAAAADSGAVTNAQTTQTTTTTTSSSGIAADGASMEGDTDMDSSMETTEMANTGGEPVLMSLFGLSLALGAFAVRKRVAA